ncbi:hypothetical protein [Arthrobacter sp. UYEF3]|uniref:hypothetical protein n=1 Tax=Arthrobacter sp. UYEF3 TaxID=1756365 RepID=UPI003392A649
MLFAPPLPSRPRLARSVLAAAAGVAVALGASACSPTGSIESTDVASWKATALPSASGIVLADAGKILNRDPIAKDANVPAGSYTLTMSCDGGGKEFFEISLDGKRLMEAGAACNGSRETARVTVPAAGRLTISASSVDGPLIFAYQVVPAG